MPLTLNDIKAVRIRLASPEVIRKLSFGEVKKPETINYKTLKPERDGLFCERIFGPVRDYECACGKYKRSKAMSLLMRTRQKGFRCERCGVEITRSKVRRERLGHIELAAPVVHIWYYKGNPSVISLLLNISQMDLEKVVSFQAWLTTEVIELNRELLHHLTRVTFMDMRRRLSTRWETNKAKLKEIIEEVQKHERKVQTASDKHVISTFRELLNSTIDIIDRLFEGIILNLRSLKYKDVESKFTDFHLELNHRLKDIGMYSFDTEELTELKEQFLEIVKTAIDDLLSPDISKLTLQRVDEGYIYFRDFLLNLNYKNVISEMDYSQAEKVAKEYMEKLQLLNFLLYMPEDQLSQHIQLKDEIKSYLLELRKDIPILIAIDRMDNRDLRTLLELLRNYYDKLLVAGGQLTEEVQEALYEYRTTADKLIFDEENGLLAKYNLLSYIELIASRGYRLELSKYKREFIKNMKRVLTEIVKAQVENTVKVTEEGEQIEIPDTGLKWVLNDEILENYLLSRFEPFHNTYWSHLKKAVETSKELMSKFKDFIRSYPEFGKVATFMTGAEAIKKLLDEVDVDKLYTELKERIERLLEWELKEEFAWNRDVLLLMLMAKYFRERESALDNLSNLISSNNLEPKPFVDKLKTFSSHFNPIRLPEITLDDIDYMYLEVQEMLEDNLTDDSVLARIKEELVNLKRRDIRFYKLFHALIKVRISSKFIFSNELYELLNSTVKELNPMYSSLLFAFYLLRSDRELLKNAEQLEELRKDLIASVLLMRTPVEEYDRLLNSLDEDESFYELLEELKLLPSYTTEDEQDADPIEKFKQSEYGLYITLGMDLNSVDIYRCSAQRIRDLISAYKLSGNTEILRGFLKKVADTMEKLAGELQTLKEELQTNWLEFIARFPGALTLTIGEFQIARTQNITTRNKLIKRLEIVRAFKLSGVKPSWMVLEVIPVLPPELRPIVPLEGGKFASSDLNDLYRRIINRNLRLKRLYDLDAPKMIINNEKRMLQESVDALIDNSKKAKPVMSQGSTKRMLKSLSDNLRGKQGRFRHNLLGKRVDYSGRAVIVVNPKLKMYQCGVPKKMALELFKPFLIRKLQNYMPDITIKRAKRMIDQEHDMIWDVLEEVISDHPVLLNRAPTLHRLSIQAFQPVLVEGKALQIHPLVCTPYNADFDGDQMSIHVPLSPEAKTESRVLMLSIHNMLIPASGLPANSPTQDMVTGAYYLTTLLKPFDKSEVKRVFSSFTEVLQAYETGVVDLHDWIGVYVSPDLKVRDSVNSEPHPVKSKPPLLYTTVGRVIFNENLRAGILNFDPDFEFLNMEMDKKTLRWLVEHLIYKYGMSKTAPILDILKDMTFNWATRSGLSISMSDLVVPEEKARILEEAEREAALYRKYYELGLISESKLSDMYIDLWTRITNQVTDALKAYFMKHAKLNPIWMMANSGARGSISQVKQLSGMRGLMVDPTGEVIPTPVKSSFKEGLTVLEYFISTHGARKGLVDTALRTADSGYLTRRMVDVLQDIYVREDDCGTTDGIVVTAIKQIDRDLDNVEKVKLSEAFGRVLAQDVVLNGEVILKVNTTLDWWAIKKLKENGVNKVTVYSEKVLVPFERRIRGRISLQDFVNPETGEVILRAGELITMEKAKQIAKYYVSAKVRSVLKCRTYKGVCRKCYGEDLARGNVLIDLGEAVGIIAAQSIGEPGTQLTLRTFHTGGVAMEDIIQGLPRVEYLFEARKPKYASPWLPESVQLESIENTEKGYKVVLKGLDFGNTYQLIVPYDRKLSFKQPSLTRTKDKLKVILPAWEPVMHGTLSVKKTLESSREMLERIALRKVYDNINGNVFLNLMPETVKELWISKRVPESELFNLAQEIVSRKIEELVMERIQNYIVQEIQKVYVNQGVNIHDKHIELIVRQMCRFAKVIDPGDTDLYPNKLIDHMLVEKLNEKLKREGKKPIKAQRVILGITKAALNTESFLSAASFQETTKVLTYAAIEGQTDRLNGLKENVIIGKLIPVGTGFWKYRDLKISVTSDEESADQLFGDSIEHTELSST